MASKSDKGVNVQVLLRCRPLSLDDVKSRVQQVVKCNEARKEVSVTQTVAGKPNDKLFTYDRVFGPTSKQHHLYKLAIAPIVDEVLEGFNCTIFAYGQTGTGKTYSMQGDVTQAGENGQLPEGAGVIPRSIKHIFDTLDSQGAEYNIKVTYLELYNEEITDLLAPDDNFLSSDSKAALPLMDDGKGGVIVRGLEEEVVNTSSDIFKLLERGSSKRKTAETMLNKQSSRSHSIFTITIHIKESTPEGVELVRCGKLNLVDLAGSECVGKSGAKDGRAREAGEINKSLLTLGRVITALVDHTGHIPYRDSKLTRLLRDSLGGRTKTCIIATVSPIAHCVEETLSTLEYAQRAKSIKNKPEVNQRATKFRHLKEMAMENEGLKQELNAQREKDGVYMSFQKHKDLMDELQALKDITGQNRDELEQKEEEMKQLSAQVGSLSDQVDILTKQKDGLEDRVNALSNDLERSQSDLQKAVSTIGERDRTIERMTEAERQLLDTCKNLRQKLASADEDNAGLFAKIGRMQEVSIHNKNATAALKQQMEHQIDGVRAVTVQQLEKMAAQDQKASEGVHGVLGQSAEGLREASEAVAQLSHSISAMTQQKKECLHAYVHKNGSSVESLETILGLHRDEMEKLLLQGSASSEASLEHIRAHLARLSSGWEHLQVWWKKHAEQRKAVSSSALQSLNDLLGQLHEETSTWSHLLVQQKEARVEDLNSFRKQVADVEAKKMKMISDTVNKMLQEGYRTTMGMVDNKISMMHQSENEQCAERNSKTLNLQSHYSRMSSVITDLRDKEDGADAEATNEVALKTSEAGKEVVSGEECVHKMHSDGNAHRALVSSQTKTHCDHMAKTLQECRLESANLEATATTLQEQTDVVCHEGAARLVTLLSGHHSGQKETLEKVSALLAKSCESVPGALDQHHEQVEGVKGSLKKYLEVDFKLDTCTSRTPKKRHLEIEAEEDFKRMCYFPHEAHKAAQAHPTPRKVPVASPRRIPASPGASKAFLQKPALSRGSRGPLFNIAPNNN